MDTILQGLQELDGVLGVAVIDPTGQVIGYRAHTVYDLALLQQVSRVVANAIDSIQLLQSDWESVTTNFSDGRLLLRNLATGPNRTKGSLLALLLIADGRLNLSFAGVAIRVAVGKLKNLAAMPAPAMTMASAMAASQPSIGGPGMGLPSQGVPMTLGASAPGYGMQVGMHHSAMGGSMAQGGVRQNLAASGLSWSGLGGSSALAASGVAVTDASSAAYLTTCTKALAKSVGPMAKTFVKEAIRKLWPDRPFSRDLGPALATELERHIEDKDDLSQFRKVVKSI